MVTFLGRLRPPKTSALSGAHLKGVDMYRNKKLLEAVRDAPCQHCGSQDGTVVAAHSNSLSDGKGRGIKAHDYKIAAMCFTCHTELDQGNRLTKLERREMWQDAHIKTIAWLFENDKVTVK